MLFTLTQCLFRAPSLIDIRHQVVPTDDATVGITLRTTPHMEPAVHTIGATVPRFNIKWLPGFDRAPIRVDHARKIIGMVSVADAPILQFLSGLAEILQDLAAEKFDLACRIRGRDKTRKAVDGEAQALLIRPQGIFSPLRSSMSVPAAYHRMTSPRWSRSGLYWMRSQR